MYDLIIAYRVYPKISKEPFVFANDKLRLTELGLASLKRSLATLKVKMYALLDACPDEDADLHVLRLDGIGNSASFLKQVALLCNDDSAEYVYFAEDDYVHREHQFAAMLDFMRRSAKVDFIAPFDHLDYYTSDLHCHPVEIRFGAGYHWQQRSSTCLTFVARRFALLATQRIFATFAKRNYDASIWISLTKFRVWNIGKLWRYFRIDKPIFTILAKA